MEDSGDGGGYGGEGGTEVAWICGSCTYPNDASSLSICAMCRTDRSASRHGLSFFHRPLAAAFTNTIFRNLVFDGHASLPFSLCIVPHFLAGALSGVLTGMFAVVGAFTGAVTGALAGRATNSGLLRGAGLGAAAGAVLSVEVLEASWSYWHSERTRFMRSSSLAEFLDDFLNGRFTHDRFSSPMLSINNWQVNLSEMSYEDLYDMFGPGEGIVKGVPESCLKRLPCYTVTNVNKLDSCGESIGCAICLQELQGGETVRSLPSCQHVYHMDCIDVWLFKQGSCPVCRQHVEGKF